MKKVKFIAIIRLGGWADTVLINFMGPALKEKYPDAKLTLVTSRSLYDWAGCLQFDEVILVREKSFFSKKLHKRLMEKVLLAVKFWMRRFDLGISLDSHFSHRKLKSLGVKKTAGFGRFNFALPKEDKLNPMDRCLVLLKALEISPQKLNFKLKVRQPTEDLMLERLQVFGLHEKGFLALNPGGGLVHRNKFKNQRWPYFAEFIKLFCERTGLPILLLGEECDSDLVMALTDIDPHRIFSWIGQSSREEMLAVLAKAFAFVGCDSGLGFVAGSVGVPSVILYGPRSSKVDGPPGNGKTVICLDGVVPCSPCHVGDGVFDWSCRDNVCMKSISPQDVWKALTKISQLPENGQASGGRTKAL